MDALGIICVHYVISHIKAIYLPRQRTEYLTNNTKLYCYSFESGNSTITKIVNKIE